MKLEEAAETIEGVGEAAKGGVRAVRDRRRRTRQRLEEVFSRKTLGAVFVSLSAGKVVEQLIVLAAPSRLLRLGAWFVAFWVFVWLFVKWERVAERARQAAEAAEEVTGGD